MGGRCYINEALTMFQLVGIYVTLNETLLKYIANERYPLLSIDGLSEQERVEGKLPTEKGNPYQKPHID